MPARIAPDTRRQIAKLARDGATMASIAAAVGVDRHTVARILAAAAPNPTGAVPRGRAGASIALGPFTEAEVARLRYLLAALPSGHPCPACGKTMYSRESDVAGTCSHCGTGWRVDPPLPAGPTGGYRPPTAPRNAPRRPSGNRDQF